MGSAGCMPSSPAFRCVESPVPVRATYTNLYKWPESDAEFVKSVATRARGGASAGDVQQRRRSRHHRRYQQPRVVDSYSCRQMFLRSYTFSKKESVPERTRKCLGKVKEKVVVVVANGKRAPGCVRWGAGAGEGNGDMGLAGGDRSGAERKKRCAMAQKLRKASSAALCSIFHRLLSCAASVDVVECQP